MNILDEILAHKHQEVTERKALYPVALLEKSIYFASPVVSLRKYLQRTDKTGIIAEFKRASPSKGLINQYVSVERTSIGYMQSGASALSILTDSQYFKGSNEDLQIARKCNYCPILRKDFMVDEYQIVEAKSIGADVILLIAAALKPQRLRELATFAHSLGLETLLEIHNREELERSMNDHISVVGINNRDLTTFTVSLQTSLELVHCIPTNIPKVSESGIQSPADYHLLKNAGFQGFLIGEQFMKHSRPEKACADFIRDIQIYSP